MTDSELAGVVVPAITPVDDEDRVDEAAFRKGLRRLKESSGDFDYTLPRNTT